MWHRLALGAVGFAALGVALSASAAGIVIVSPGAPQGWFEGDMRTTGTVDFVSDPSSPFGDGALELTTGSGDTAAKAQYLHPAGIPLADVTAVGYSTKYVAGPPYAGASFQLVLQFPGGAFTTLVYEPYWNSGTKTVDTSGAWQAWNGMAPGAQWWSSRNVSVGTCQLTAGAGGPPFYTVQQVQALCPGATVAAFGVNVGTYNPGYRVRVDGVVFNDTTYDFELPVTVRVVNTLNVVGFTQPGAGWEYTLEGCGVGPLTAVTDAAGIAEFINLNPAVGCSYTVTQTAQPGWTPQFVSQTAQPVQPGTTVALEFLNIRVYDPPCVEPDDPRCQPPPVPAPATPPAPTPAPATPAPPAPIEQPTTAPSPTPAPSRTTAPAELTPAPTPRPPATGSSAPADAPSWPLLAAAGLALASVGVGLAARARRR